MSTDAPEHLLSGALIDELRRSADYRLLELSGACTRARLLRPMSVDEVEVLTVGPEPAPLPRWWERGTLAQHFSAREEHWNGIRR